MTAIKVKCPLCQGPEFEEVFIKASRYKPCWYREVKLLGLLVMVKPIRTYRCKQCGFLVQIGQE